MVIRRVLYVEDNIGKFMDVSDYIKQLGVLEVKRVNNAERAVEAIESAEKPFDLFLFDMHFNFFGKDDQKAGENLMHLLREKGYNTPVVFCSSENWKIEGAAGNIFYNPRRNWEDETKELFDQLKKL